jgi:hypothetical protein
MYNGGYPRLPIEAADYANPTNKIVPGILYTNQVHYFSIEPCSRASSLTITLTGIKNFDAIELLADRSGIPTGDPETDDYVVLRNNQNPNSVNGVATFQIDDTRPAGAPYVSGKRIFIALRNRFEEMTNSYRLSVRLQRGICLPPIVPVLRKNQAFAATVPVLQNAPEEEEGDVYQVNVAPGATSISLNVQAEGDVAIVAQKGMPPTRSSFSHFQNNPGSGSEQLTISSNSGVPLASGVWYVRVLNNTSLAVPYTITATGDISDTGVAEPLLSAAVVNGQLQIQWSSAAGIAYEVQASEDLNAWTSVGNVISNGGIMTFTPPAGSGHMRFYRLVRQ